MTLRSRSGTTLLELLCGLTLLGVLLGMVSLPTAYAGDVMAARAARAAVLAAAATARAVAIQHGGAELRIGAAEGMLAVVSRDGVVADTLASVTRAYRVRIDLGGDDVATATIHFDALGIGRLANRTVRLSRGRVSAGVTFSAYGRARPW